MVRGVLTMRQEVNGGPFYDQEWASDKGLLGWMAGWLPVPILE